MKIKSLTINNISGIKHFNIENLSDNVTLLVGKVGIGKTSILSSIYSLFCKDELIKWYDGNECNELSNISVTLNNFGNEISIDEQILPNGNRYILNCHSVDDYMNGNLNNKVFFYNYRSSQKTFTVKQLQEIISFSEQYDVDLKNVSIETIKTKFLSGGQITFLGILFYISRIPAGSIVLVDELPSLDDIFIEMLFSLFSKINNLQFICATRHSILPNDNILQINLTEDMLTNYITNTEMLGGYLISTPLGIDNDESDKLSFVKYKLGCTLKEEENIEVEFKSIGGNNPIRSIVDISDQYAVAFLNATSINCGIIKWGITDDGVVKGVVLDRNARDKIRRDIQSKMNNVYPAIDSGSYELHFEKIVDEAGNIITDLFIVELVIYCSYSRRLYSTGNSEVYIKLNGVKQKLTPYQIQIEVLKRNHR